MKWDSFDLARLLQVTEAAYTAEQAKMTALSQKEGRLRTQIGELNAARYRTQTLPEDDITPRVGADYLWQSWVDSRVSALNTELARTLVEKSRLRVVLKRSFGKHQVAGHYYEQARLARLRDRDGEHDDRC